MICREVFGSSEAVGFVDQQQFRILDERPADADRCVPAGTVHRRACRHC